MPPDQPVASLHGASGSEGHHRRPPPGPPSLRPAAGPSGCLRAAPEGPSRAHEGSVRPTAFRATRVNVKAAARAHSRYITVTDVTLPPNHWTHRKYGSLSSHHPTTGSLAGHLLLQDTERTCLTMKEGILSLWGLTQSCFRAASGGAKKIWAFLHPFEHDQR